MTATGSEADRLVAAARKAITKPTLALFWKPDYETAAQNYEKAAGLWKVAHADKAIDALGHAAEHWVKADSYFMAAKAAEQAAQLATKAQQHRPACDLYKKASDYFVLNSTPDRAAEMLEKAAKSAEDAMDNNLALEMYTECIALHHQEDRHRMSVDVIKKAVAFCIKAELHDKAVAFLEQQLSTYAHVKNENGVSKSALSLIVYLLHIGDEVRAQQTFQMAMDTNQLARDEAMAASAILDAWEAGDNELLTKACAAQIVTFLDTPIVRIARKLTVQEFSKTSPSGQPASAPPAIPGFDAAQVVPTPPTATHTPVPRPLPSLPQPTPSDAALPPPAPIPGLATASPPVPIPGLQPPTTTTTAAVPPIPIPGFTASPAPAASPTGPPQEEEEGFC